MRIYADTSFLVSLLYPPDVGHAAAANVFRHNVGAEWQTSEWTQFETFNALRQLCRKNPGPPPEIPEALRRYFKHLHTAGQFVFSETDLVEALRECQQLSAAHGTTIPMRAADVLHVALLEQINPDLFVTRDKAQYDLATARAFPSRLVP